MTVPVVWYGNKPGILNRGYWDQGLFEALLTQIGGFTHHAATSDLPDGQGAVVAIPARWFIEPAEVAAINAAINRLPWVLVVLFGDEEGSFPWRDLRHPRIRLWVQTAHPGIHPNDNRVFWIGDGWPPDAPGILAQLGDVRRELNWFFAGNVNHVRRQQAVGAMQARRSGADFGAARPDGACHTTKEFGSGLPYDRYLADMAASKTVVCPSGNYSPDCFRLFEALEAGCIPIADRYAPNTPGERNYWQILFATNDLPFPIVDDWTEFSPTVDRLLPDWQATANRCGSLWELHKRRMRRRLIGDIAWLSDRRLPTGDNITVLMPTSPIATHPDTTMIGETIRSVRDRLPNADILVMVDGIRPEQEGRRRDYDEYTRRLFWRARHEWAGVTPVVYDQWLHQAEMTARTLSHVDTDLLLFVEHDTPLVNDIDWDACASALSSGEANVIRYHHESHVLEPHAHLMLDGSPRMVAGCPLQATVQWSQRPHLARTDWYRWMIGTHFGRYARTMIEDVIYGVIHQAWLNDQRAGWDPFRLFLYTPPEGTIQRSTNLDGRGVEPKYGMIFAYPEGPIPPGAPAPHRDEDPAGSPSGLPCPCVDGA